MRLQDQVTSYATCGLCFTEILHDLNWAAIGGGILLVARIVVDVPQAWDFVVKRYNIGGKYEQSKRESTE
jgi:hypothetical protein